MTTWNARGWAIATAIGVFGVLAPAESHAACTGSDLAGTWKIYELLTGNVDSGWMTCTVKIGSGGGVKSGTSCTEKEAGSGSRFSSTIRGGTINLRSSCRITGNFKVGDCRHTIMDGSISDDGKKMSGVGKDCGGSGSLIIFNGIKR